MAMVEISETKSIEVNEVKVNGMVYTIHEVYYLLRDTVIPRKTRERIACLLINWIWSRYGRPIAFVINPYADTNAITLVFTKTHELVWPITKDNSLIFIDFEELAKEVGC